MLTNNKRVYKQTENQGTTQVKELFNLPTNPQRLLQPLLNLYIQFSRENLAKKLLIILFFILPCNLGKHFEMSSSWINTSVVPYLIPTLYLQDILVVVVLLVIIAMRRHSTISAPLVRGDGPDFVGMAGGDGNIPRLFFLFLFAVFLSMFFAGRFYPSVYSFVRLFLYFLFFVATIYLFRTPSVRRWFFISLIVNTILLSILGFLQFYKQTSVFNNYLFFGEQPYSVYTPYIAKESFGGVVKIPPYGTFLHPNIFAGYLVFSITLSLGYFLNKRVRSFIPSIFLTALVAVVLFLTKSYTAWAAFALGLLLLLFVRLRFAQPVKNARLIKSVFLFLTFTIILLGLLFPFYKNRALMLLPTDSITSTLSVERRSDMLKASYKMISQKPFFGWGVNSFTYSFEPFYSRSDVVRFLQPVHNVYALVATEVGVLGALLFMSLILYAIYYAVRHDRWLYSVALVQIITLSSFDHYFFTIPQMQLLFILTLMMGLTYTKDNNCL